MSGKPIYIPRPGERKSPGPRPRLDRDWKRELRIWWREIDRWLLALVLALMVAGTLAVAAASPASAHRLSTDEKTLPALYFFWAHVRWQFVGVIVLLATSMVGSRELRRGAIMLGAAMLAGLLLVPVVGSEINGARRWLNLGFSLQPSEFLKPAFALILAWVLSWKVRDATLPVVGTTAAFVGVICLLLMMQPDLGSAILFAACWVVMVVVAGLPLQRLGYLSGAGALLLVLAYLFYDNARNRIDTFLGGPTAFDHVDLASRTLGGGGWFGTGFWLGREKMRLPEAHTDYIFSVIGEEFGLIACAGIVVLYLAIVLRVLVRLVEEDRLYLILAASGLTALIGGQAFINVLVNLQLFPSKGMTLPLVSYGGSSTIAICLTVGMLLAVTRRNPYLEREPFDVAAAFEKDDEA